MANSFTADISAGKVKLYCKFESGALRDCVVNGANYLTAVNTPASGAAVPVAAPVDGGTGGADLEYYDNDYFSIADSNLPTGFPGKGGTPSSFSVGVFFKPEGSNWQDYQALIKKETWSTSGYDIMVQVDKKVRMDLSWSGGNAIITFGTALTNGNEYFICGTYNHSTRAYRLHVYDITNAQPLGADVTGTAASVIAGGSEVFYIGYANYALDGLIDSLVVSNEVWSTTSIDQIRAGSYGAGAATVVTPETAVLAAAGTIPKASLVLARGARALTWNGGAVQASGVLGPALATVLLYGQVPQASLSQQVPAAAGTVAGQDAKASLAIGPGAAAVSWVGQAVAVASGVLVEVGAAALTIVGNAVQASVVVAVSVGALVWRGLTVSTGGAQRLAGILGSMFRRLIGG